MYATAMEEYPGKRAAGGLAVPRKGSSLVLREKGDNKDQNAQFCNRLGCSGRLHYSKGTQTGCSSDKPKPVRTTLCRSTTGKEMSGTSKEMSGSSKTLSGCSNSKRTFRATQKNVTNKPETDSTDSSSSSVTNVQDDKLEVSERKEAESSKVQSTQVGSSSSVTPNPKSRKIFRQKTVLGNQETQLSSVSSTSRSPGQLARENASTSATRYGLRNLRCNSTSDVIPQVSSSSESNKKGKELARKRNPERESISSVKGKKLSGPSSLSTSSALSTSDYTRRNRNWPSSGEVTATSSVRTRRPMNLGSRLTRPNQVSRNNSSSRESPMGFSQMIQAEASIDGNVSTLSNQFTRESSSTSGSSSYTLPTNDTDGLHNLIPLRSVELGISRLRNRNGPQQYNMDSIAEVLLALERIEHNEELSYEQLLVLESNLFLGGLNFYDQHRDMRLDIDNMTYEELLALEEKMGNVSTALSEEALINCLRKDTYHHPISPEECSTQITGDGDLTKCSVCQEEYADGDEIGRLGCEHNYHALCIQQWLRLKNWCPICKGSVAPPPPPPPPAK